MKEASQIQKAVSSRSLPPMFAGFGEVVSTKWNALSTAQKVKACWGVVGFCSVVTILVYWMARPEWSLLYSGLTPDEERQISVVLSTSGITYDVSADGAVLRVPAQQLDKARLVSAAKASGKSGRLGFELFDKPDWAGSDFDEKVNYQRALEGELEKSIDSLSDVQSSNVHLVLPHDSLFASVQRDSKASVVVRLRGQQLMRGEAESIKALVANAVDGLRPENVVLLDADGRGLGDRTSSSDMKANYEQSLAGQILQTLEPVAGAGNVRATVNVEYDSTLRDTVNEDYDPDSVVTLTMQRSEQNLGARLPAAGIPGTASNAPSQQAPLFPDQKPEPQTSKQESGTYGASKRTEHITQSPGNIRKVTAAVIVNDRTIPNLDPKKPPVQRPWTPDELKQLSSLSQAAIGYDGTRGDLVVVQNLQFDTKAVAKAGFLANAFLQLRSQGSLIKDMIAMVIALSTIFLVVRPAMVLLKTNIPEARILHASALPVFAGSGDTATAEESRGLFDQVVTQIQADPSQSARLLQTWIHTD